MLLTAQVISPCVEVSNFWDDLDVDYKVIFRVTLENGQVMDIQYTHDIIVLGTGGILTDCKPEDFQ